MIKTPGLKALMGCGLICSGMALSLNSHAEEMTSVEQTTFGKCVVMEKIEDKMECFRATVISETQRVKND